MSLLDYVFIFICLVVMAANVGFYLKTNNVEQRFLNAASFIVWGLVAVDIIWNDIIPKPFWPLLAGIGLGYLIGREVVVATFQKDLEDLKQRYDKSISMNNFAQARWDLMEALKKDGLINDENVDN